MRKKSKVGSLIKARLTQWKRSVALKSARRAVGRTRVTPRFFRKLKRLRPVGKLLFALAALIVIAIPVTVVILVSSPRPASDQPSIAQVSSNPFSGDGGDGSAYSVPTPSPTPIPTPIPTPEPTIHPSNTVFKEGTTSDLVIGIQERLMELGYMDHDEPTEYYGNMTKAAIKLFQRKHSLTIDGQIGIETYQLLMSDQALNYSVSQGEEGTDVEEYQKRLVELGYMKNVTGFFGDETIEAVKSFQDRNGLSPDGTIGEKTREMLYSGDARSQYYEKGQESDEIRNYQKKLSSLGYLTTEPDGKYGDDTSAAVKRFQERNGLIGDGYLGPETIKLLMSSRALPNALAIGVSGDDVTNVQKRLKSLNYMKNVTGYFGSETEDAVRSFQKRNGLSVDGRVGKKTMAVLTSDNAKKAASGSSSGSGSSGSGSSGSGSSGPESSGSGSSPNSTGVEKFISVAESKLGCKYSRGSKGPSKFDCSGFVYWCLNQAGVKQGYMTSYAWRSTSKYERISKMGNLERGDVVVYKGHVGIYMGGGKMIDASSSQGKVRVTTNIQKSDYWTRNFICGYRIF